MKKLLVKFFGTSMCCAVLVTPLSAADLPVLTKDSAQWLGNTSQAFEIHLDDGLKHYYLKTDAPLRDNYPTNKEVKIEEHNDMPRIRSSSPLFDSLFALAIQEMKTSSVSTIHDSAFDSAQCDCFETGDKWKYVWTRDTAYAMNLGLASLDPERAKNSLLFKISGFRHNLGNGEQIVQDTGSGGSWPVSTDRVIWSAGAIETLKALEQGSHSYNYFFKRAYQAMKNTAESDRISVYDSNDGLYTGEQSFLDWREQSYPIWTRKKVVHIGMSKSLSTNVAHYINLKSVAELANRNNDFEVAARYKIMAKSLQESIKENFWDGSSLSSLKTTFLDQRPLKYFDLLGISLAILNDVVTMEEGRSALNTYPQTKVGPPVIWPQLQEVPIYHNRAIWPFVTAYALKAAKKVAEPNLVTAYTRSLILGPAQNLSMMENYEFLTLRNWFYDGDLSGPVVNSRRQLWSIGAHLALVVDVIFGKETGHDGIRFKPGLTNGIRKMFFQNQSQITLEKYPFQNKFLNVALDLPNDSQLDLSKSDAFFEIESIKLNDRALALEAWIAKEDLEFETNTIVIKLKNASNYIERNFALVDLPRKHNGYSKDERQYLYMPRSPELAQVVLSDNFPLLSFYSNDNSSVTYLIFKNGKYLESTRNTHYLDRSQDTNLPACYSVVAKFEKSGNESFPSEPHCYWPNWSIQHYPVKSPHITTSNHVNYQSAKGRVYLKDWGQPYETLQLNNFKPTHDGTYAIQIDYNNLSSINTGITCSVKRVSIFNESNGERIKSGILMMPHHDWDNFWTDSNFLTVDLKAGNSYRFFFEDNQNMSYLEHFNSYLLRGGKSGIDNKFNFAEIKVLYLGNN